MPGRLRCTIERTGAGQRHTGSTAGRLCGDGGPELRGLVEGLLVVCKVTDANGKRQKLYFFTTLNLTPDKLLEMYGYRWNIETDLRSLKREVRLHMMEARSKDMVDKELVLAVAAYNLTRA